VKPAFASLRVEDYYLAPTRISPHLIAPRTVYRRHSIEQNRANERRNGNDFKQRTQAELARDCHAGQYTARAIKKPVALLLWQALRSSRYPGQGNEATGINSKGQWPFIDQVV
jgi:hypothetical protein